MPFQRMGKAQCGWGWFADPVRLPHRLSAEGEQGGFLLGTGGAPAEQPLDKAAVRVAP
jgi:hypothetical protein